MYRFKPKCPYSDGDCAVGTVCVCVSTCVCVCVSLLILSFIFSVGETFDGLRRDRGTLPQIIFLFFCLRVIDRRQFVTIDFTLQFKSRSSLCSKTSHDDSADLKDPLWRFGPLVVPWSSV